MKENEKTDGADTPALEARLVCHGYGKGASAVRVLDGLSLEIGSGEFVALMGPSGSGKSTFLHIAAGLLTPDSGEMFVGGEKVSAMGDGEAARFRRRREGVVFQAFNLIEGMTVADNIALPALLDGRKADGARVADLVSRLGLAGCERRRPGALSGGERQRVAIARALYVRPSIVLADEPTGNLDVKTSREICSLLRELNASERSAILLVTHDPVVASCASRVCFLDGGRIVGSYATKGDPAEISKLYVETYG